MEPERVGIPFRAQEDPGADEPVDQWATVPTAGDRVGGRGGQPVQDAGAQQERQGVRPDWVASTASRK